MTALSHDPTRGEDVVGTTPCLWILLPAFNEEKSLPVLLPKFQQALQASDYSYRILVCDDGSTDNTTPLLEQYSRSMPLEYIRHKINRGLGETSRDLFEWAATLAADNDIIIRLDCDDTHEPSLIHSLIAKLNEGNDVVIASRFQKGGGQVGVSRYRAFISRCANLFMKTLFPVRGVWEYSCGYRAYRAGLIKEAIRTYGNAFIQLKGMGFTCTLEKLVKLKLLGARFAEVPFTLRYDQKQSSSKMISSITTLGYLVMVICYYWPWNGWSWQYRGLPKWWTNLPAEVVPPAERKAA
ncbi:MAG TPA: glycosyltransferase family 2 protein [Gemmataceae bacterium]|nr:glycosyltransferase family 2 protein [Gemmataceae bacterium]